MLVGGGVGISPVISICKDLLCEHYQFKRKIASITLVWTCTNGAIFQDRILSDVIQFSQYKQLDCANGKDSSHPGKALLRLKLYATR